MKLPPTLIFALMIGVLMSVGAITDQSLWIDEGVEAVTIAKPTLSSGWASLKAQGNSNLQLLSHFLYLWSWDKLFGHSEMSLRIANVPWLLVGMVALFWGFSREAPYRRWVFVLAGCSPFLWYYLSEARPYIVVFGITCLAIGPLLRTLTKDAASHVASDRMVQLLLLGIVLLCATSILGVPWAGSIGVATIYATGPRNFMNAAAKHRLAILSAFAALGVLAVYYVWTLVTGARAARISFSVPEIGFAFYELCGLFGLGPSRSEIRVTGIHAFGLYLPRLLLAFGAIAPLFIAGLLEFRQTYGRRGVSIFLLAVVPPIIFTVLLALIAQFRLVGRHLTPLLPFLIIVLAIGSHRLWRSGRSGKGVTLLAIGFFLWSCMELRFAERHRRDDYRSAAMIAATALKKGEIVWWLADQTTGYYYGLPLSSEEPENRFKFLLNPSSSDLARQETPQLVVLSKPDLYDPRGVIQLYVKVHGFREAARLKDFVVWAEGTLD